MDTIVALTDGPKIRQVAAEVLRGSSPAYIASPYWSAGTVEALGFDSGSLEGKLEVLCDTRSGACDPAAIRDILSRGAKVISVDHLHAKIYMGDAGVIVGSANATSAGLWHGARKDNGNYEVALYAKQLGATQPWREWWVRTAARGIDLGDKRIANLMLDIAKAAMAVASPKPVSLLQALIDGTYMKSRTPLYATIDWQDADASVEITARELSTQLHETISYWQDWPTMPPASNIISFMLEEDGKIWLEDAWRTPSKPKLAADPRTKAIYVSKVELINGHYKIDRKSHWQRAAAICANEPKYRRNFQGNGNGLCLPIDEFLPFIKRVS